MLMFESAEFLNSVMLILNMKEKPKNNNGMIRHPEVSNVNIFELLQPSYWVVYFSCRRLE